MTRQQSGDRRSIRLPQYDYTQPGAYAITICTERREPLLGEIGAAGVQLNSYGQVVEYCWRQIPDHNRPVQLDVFVVMPNHLHGIVLLAPAALFGGAGRGSRTEAFGQPVPGSVPTLVRSFKAAATRRINQLRGTPGGRVWQRGYYERVIRNERELAAVRRYVVDNPLAWALDPENPANADKAAGT